MGEQLQLKLEENNKNYRRAVAILKDSIVVGHLPWVGKNCVGGGLKHGGAGGCETTGRRKKGNGLEDSCIYSFYGPSELVKKLSSFCCRRETLLIHVHTNV